MSEYSKELEELKKSGGAPKWMNLASYTTLSKGYRLKKETPRQMYFRVAQSAAISLGMPELTDLFFEMMWNNWLCPASPILSNLGTDRGLPISCYGLDVGDSVKRITEGISELAMLSKNAGGVGVNFQRIRPRGSVIKNGANGKSEGIIPFAKMYDSTILGISQGSTRRGAASINLNIEHEDWHEFIRMRRPEGDINRQCGNLHHCTVVNDEFMHKVEAGDVESRKKWTELMRSRMETGESYIMYKDNVNRQNPEAYKKRGLEVDMTNICCLTGETLVTTKEGPQKIEDLVGKTVTIYDGENWVECSNFEERGTTDEIYEVEFELGSKIRVTKNHRFPVLNSFEIQEKTTIELVKGDALAVHEFGDKDFYVKSITKVETEVVPVYCPNVPTTGYFALANGTMTGNSEITLYTDDDHSFICCLSSLNLARYDEWKDYKSPQGWTLPYISILFLNGVLNEFISKARYIWGLDKVVRSAEKGRAVGLGVLGWHSLLQSKSMPFDSFGSMMLNSEIFKFIQEGSIKASQDLASKHGEPEWCRDTGMYNSHLIAIAPTRSNSIISGGVSAGIEPIIANAYVDKTAKGTFIKHNPHLKELLAKKGKDDDATWKTIARDNGSVQSLSFLNEEEKKVFLTAYEIDQMALIRQASQRQKFICQAQSLNLFFPVDVKPNYFNKVHIEAWKMGVKTLYYCRSKAGIQADVASRDDCASCEG